VIVVEEMSAQTAIDSRAGMFWDVSTSGGTGTTRPTAFAYAAAARRHHAHAQPHHHLHAVARHHRLLLGHHHDYDVSSGRVGIDPSAYGRAASGGNPFGEALLAVPAAAGGGGAGGSAVGAAAGVVVHPRVLLPSTDAAVYVNAKQYNAILRRRRARAKEAARTASANASSSTSTEVSRRGVAKYASRSAHAKNRVRGKDGKYLTRAELLAGLGGPEAKARAEAREMEIAERAAKKKAREEKRELKAREKAALRASRAAAAAAAASAAAAAAAATTA